jgi:hypothetical protein
VFKELLDHPKDLRALRDFKVDKELKERAFKALLDLHKALKARKA